MLDAGRSCFERGNEDMFLFDAIDVGPMQKAVVHHDDTGFSPGWHLDSMTVTNSTTGERAHFVCEQWFDRTHGDRKIKRTLVAGGAGARGSVIEYRITVVTADVRSAGTSAGVSVLLARARTPLSLGIRERAAPLRRTRTRTPARPLSRACGRPA